MEVEYESPRSASPPNRLAAFHLRVDVTDTAGAQVTKTIAISEVTTAAELIDILTAKVYSVTDWSSFAVFHKLEDGERELGPGETVKALLDVRNHVGVHVRSKAEGMRAKTGFLTRRGKDRWFLLDFADTRLFMYDKDPALPIRDVNRKVAKLTLTLSEAKAIERVGNRLTIQLKRGVENFMAVSEADAKEWIHAFRTAAEPDRYPPPRKPAVDNPYASLEDIDRIRKELAGTEYDTALPDELQPGNAKHERIKKEQRIFHEISGYLNESEGTGEGLGGGAGEGGAAGGAGAGEADDNALAYELSAPPDSVEFANCGDVLRRLFALTMRDRGMRAAFRNFVNGEYTSANLSFAEFLNVQYTQQAMPFIDAVESFKSKATILLGGGGHALGREASALFANYVAPGAPKQLLLTKETEAAISTQFGSGGRTGASDSTWLSVFDEVLAEQIKVLRFDVFPKYVASTSYVPMGESPCDVCRRRRISHRIGVSFNKQHVMRVRLSAFEREAKPLLMTQAEEDAAAEEAERVAREESKGKVLKMSRELKLQLTKSGNGEWTTERYGHLCSECAAEHVSAVEPVAVGAAAKGVDPTKSRLDALAKRASKRLEGLRAKREQARSVDHQLVERVDKLIQVRRRGEREREGEGEREGERECGACGSRVGSARVRVSGRTLVACTHCIEEWIKDDVDMTMVVEEGEGEGEGEGERGGEGE
jgi:hypothetical protein